MKKLRFIELNCARYAVENDIQTNGYVFFSELDSKWVFSGTNVSMDQLTEIVEFISTLPGNK
jgi:hypothetical protein